MRVVRTLFSDLDGMEDRREREGLHDEIVEVKWVVMQHDSAGISNNLKNETTDHADRESPSLVLNAEPELHDQKQAKSSSIDGIASKRG
jgi:hypothetical protein